MYKLKGRGDGLEKLFSTDQWSFSLPELHMAKQAAQDTYQLGQAASIMLVHADSYGRKTIQASSIVQVTDCS